MRTATPNASACLRVWQPSARDAYVKRGTSPGLAGPGRVPERRKIASMGVSRRQDDSRDDGSRPRLVDSDAETMRDLLRLGGGTPAPGRGERGRLRAAGAPG